MALRPASMDRHCKTSFNYPQHDINATLIVCQMAKSARYGVDPSVLHTVLLVGR